MFSLYYYMRLIKLLNMENVETTTKFSRLKGVSSIEDKYSFILQLFICFQMSLLQLQRKTIIPYYEENVH